MRVFGFRSVLVFPSISGSRLAFQWTLITEFDWVRFVGPCGPWFRRVPLRSAIVCRGETTSALSERHYSRIETWMTLCMLSRTRGNECVCATGPILSRISNGPMYRGSGTGVLCGFAYDFRAWRPLCGTWPRASWVSPTYVQQGGYWYLCPYKA